MSYKKAIISNTAYQILNKVVTAGSTLIISIAITRVLGAEFYGEYSIVTTYAITYFLLSDFGVNAIVVQEFAKDQNSAKQHFSKILALRILFGILLMILGFVFVEFFPYSPLVKTAIYITLPMVLFNSISRASALIFQSFLRYDYQAWSSIIGSLITLAIIFYLIYFSNGNLINISVATLIGGLLSPILSLFFIREYLSFKAKWVDFDYWKYVLLDAFPMGMALTLNVLMIHADRLILSILSTPYSVGIYSLSYKIFDVILVLPTFIMNAVYPVLIKIKSESEDKYYETAGKVFVYMLGAGLAFSVMSIVLAPILIPYIWGDEMSNSIAPFIILSIGLSIFFLTAPLSWMILIEGKKKLLMWVYAFAFIFNTTANWIFIPIYDYYAAAILTILTEISIFLVLFIIMRNRLSIDSRNTKLLRGIFSNFKL